MNFNKKLYTVSLIAVSAFLFLGVNVYQTSTLKSDGSGTINLQYNGKKTDLQKNKFIVMNLPFSEDLAKKYFSSDGITVKSAKLDYSIKDSIYYMTVMIDFQDINKLSEATGFSNVKASLENSDAGTIFKYILLKDPDQIKNIGSLTYIIKFENPVISTNGVSKDNTVTWGSRNTKNSDFTKDVILTATLKGNVGGADDKKSCGLFGVELPILLVSGLALSHRLKRNKNRK